MNLKIVASKIYKYRSAILFIGIIFLLYIIIFVKPKTLLIEKENPLQLTELKKIRDENGKLYSQVAQQTVDKVIVDKYIDSLAKALRIEKKNIKTVDKYTTKDSIVYKDSKTKPVVYNHGKDTAYSTEFHDAWVDIKAVAGKDTGHIIYESRDTTTRVETVETHLFKGTEHFVFLGNTNPHNIIKEGASFSIKEKRAWLVIGPYVGYDFINKSGSAGIAAVIPIFQLKK